MSLTENKSIDRIEIVENGTVQVREITRIIKNGEEITRTYHRWTFAPGDDVSNMPANVQAIALAAWTPEVINTYNSMITASLSKNI